MKQSTTLAAVAAAALSASCVTVPESGEPIQAQERPVQVSPTELPSDPYCGLAQPPAETEILELSRGRITPGDGNGFHDETTISGDVMMAGNVRLTVVSGGVCKNILELEPDGGEVTWTGKDAEGNAVEPGVYFVAAKDAHGRLVGANKIVVGVKDDVCAMREGDIESLLDTRVAFTRLDFEPDILLETPNAGHLCILVQRLEGSRVKPIVGINEVPLFTPRSFTIDTDALMVSTPVASPVTRLRLGGQGGGYRIAVGHIDDPNVGSSGPQPVANESTPDTLTCRGRLLSAEHPFGLSRPYWPGLDPERYKGGRRPVPRAGVPIQCTAHFRKVSTASDTQSYVYRQNTFGPLPDIKGLYANTFVGDKPVDPPVTSQRARLPSIPGFETYPWDFGVVDPGPQFPPPIPPSDSVVFIAYGETDETGYFEIEVPIDESASELEYRGLQAKCRWGIGDCFGGQQSRFAKTFDDIDPLDILDVYDAMVNWRFARLITNAGVVPIESGVIIKAGQPNEVVDPAELGNEIFDDRIFIPAEMNDLPYVVHEPFDPLNEDSFDYIIWLLNGQPRSYENPDPENIPEIAYGDFCSIPPQNLCYGRGANCIWSPTCDATSSPVQCPSVNILKMFLDSDYDVWLIDHDYDTSVAKVAGDAPHLYQAILNYAGIDDDRKIAVSGLSSGGIIARVGLVMWERKDELPQLIAEHDLEMVNLPWPERLTEDPSRVAAYFSLDSPHRGATFPVSVQAFLHDNQFPTETPLDDLLTSDAARELLRNWVSPSIDTNCFYETSFAYFWGKNKVPQSCNVYRSTPQLESAVAQVGTSEARKEVVNPALVSRSRLDQYMTETIDVLGDRPENQGLQAFFKDGLPLEASSFAIANGPRYGPGIRHGTNEVLHVDYTFAGDFRQQSIQDFEQQERGSTYPAICRAQSLGGPSGDRISDFGASYESCYGAGGFDAVCFVEGALNQLFGWLTGSDGHPPVNVIPSVPMRYPAFVPTESAMNITEEATPGSYAFGWEDVLWSTNKQFPEGSVFRNLHFNINEDSCLFMRYHLDGTMKGDRDGTPACRGDMLNSCLNGGMAPGRKIDASENYESDPGAFCDCDESTTDMYASRACAITEIPSQLNEMRLR